jgi:hypothetical protein
VGGEGDYGAAPPSPGRTEVFPGEQANKEMGGILGAGISRMQVPGSAFRTEKPVSDLEGDFLEWDFPERKIQDEKGICGANEAGRRSRKQRQCRRSEDAGFRRKAAGAPTWKNASNRRQ